MGRDAIGIGFYLSIIKNNKNKIFIPGRLLPAPNTRDQGPRDTFNSTRISQKSKSQTLPFSCTWGGKTRGKMGNYFAPL